MSKEGKTDEKEVERKRNLKPLWIIGLILLFLIAAWLVLTSFRHNWSAHFISISQNETDTKQKAINLYKAKILAPMSEAPYLELGKLANTQKNYAAAQKNFQTALKFNSKDSQAYFYLINSLINQDKIDEAKKNLDKVEVIDPNNPEIVFLKARFFIADQKLDQAENLLEQISSRNNKYLRYHTLILLSEGKSDIIKKGADEQLNLLVEEFMNSENEIYKKTLLGLEWVKLDERKLGCSLAADAKNKNQNITQQLSNYQKLFNYCKL